MKRFIRDESGLSLIEVSMAGALFVAISLGLATMNNNSLRASRSLALTNDLNAISSSISQMLASPPSCLSFMQDAPVSGNYPGAFPVALTRVRSNGVDLAVRATAGQETGLAIRNILLHRDPGDSGTENPDLGVLAGVGPAYVVTLRLEAERIGDNKQLAGSKTLVRDFPIRVVTNGAGVIVGCHRDPGLEAICNSMATDAGYLAAMTPPGSRGMLCDMGPEICRQLGGTYTEGANPPCAYSAGGVPGVPLANITERVCLDMGGTFTGGMPACTFDNNRDTGATSVTSACRSLGGTLVGGAPAICDFCIAHGGEWNANIGIGGGCDFNRRFCMMRNGPTIPAIYNPVNQTCDSSAADCERIGGSFLPSPGDGTLRCRLQMVRGPCRTIVGGWTDHVETDRDATFPPGGTFCAADEYLANLRGRTTRHDNGNVEEQQVEITCCRNGF